MSQPLKSFAAACCAVLVAAAAAPAGADEPKILNFARTGQFESLDPVRQFDETSSDVVTQLYSTLLTYSYLERPYKLIPDLLERMPEASKDGLTYTFRLRKGVLFHDDPCFPGAKGREMNSDDVLYSLQRFADARLNNKSWFTMEGAVVGLDDYRAATAKAAAGADLSKSGVAGFRKIDATTFTLRLVRPNPLFLFALAISPASIVPREAVEKYKDQFGVHPVGSGPFTLHDVNRKGVLHLLRNPSFYGTYPAAGASGDAEKGLLKDAGRRLPLVDGIDMPLIEEAQPAALMFLKGELDWRGLDRANFSKLVKREGEGRWRVADEYASRFDIYWTRGVDASFYGINMKDALLGANKPLRQAFAHLVDTPAEIEVLLNGRGEKLKSIVPIELPGGERDTAAQAAGYDPAAAKKLLAEAGYPGGQGLPAFTVSFAATSIDTRNQFDQLKAKFAAAGVQLKGEFLDQPTFIKNIEGGKAQMFYTGWVADYPDAEDFYQLLYSKNVAPGPNSSSFANAEYDKAYETSRLMANGPARYALFKSMNDIIQDQVPLILGFNSLRFGITQKWLRNFKRNLLVPEFRFLDIDVERRRQGLK